MNPNSQHQVWSKWTFMVRPATRNHAHATVEANCARFGRKAFGSTGVMRVRYQPPVWIVEALVEGVPVQEARYVAYMKAQWLMFFKAGFGGQSQVTASAVLVAGPPANGGPPDQLVIVSGIPVTTTL